MPDWSQFLPSVAAEIVGSVVGFLGALWIAILVLRHDQTKTQRENLAFHEKARRSVLESVRRNLQAALDWEVGRDNGPTRLETAVWDSFKVRFVETSKAPDESERFATFFAAVEGVSRTANMPSRRAPPTALNNLIASGLSLLRLAGMNADAEILERARGKAGNREDKRKKATSYKGA